MNTKKCMEKLGLKTGVVEGEKAARYFGAEAEANALLFSDYCEDIANYAGYESWSDVPKEVRVSLRELFAAGRKAEKAHRS